MFVRVGDDVRFFLLDCGSRKRVWSGFRGGGSVLCERGRKYM